MTRRRRDPRAELAAQTVPGTARRRIARGRRPETRDRGPDRGRRRDPRAIKAAASVRVGGRLRIDWSREAPPVQVPATTVAPAKAAEPERVVIDEPAYLVFAVLDQPDGTLGDHDRQVLAAARLLADAGGGAVIAFAPGGADGLAVAGADRAVALPAEWATGYRPEERAAAVLAGLAAWSPRHVLFPESPTGGDIARRVAAGCGERLFPGVRTLAPDRAGRPAMGGTVELMHAPPRLMTVAPDAVAPLGGDVLHEARPLELPPFQAERRLLDARRLPVDPDALPLAEADFIVSAGNGVTDWPAFADLAAVLGATRAGSRVACDAGHLPRERQVGASGTVVTARCYVALGIAGAPQHLQGITGVQHVVAVNTDLHAEMIKRADLAIVADAQEVMPALIRHARERAGRVEMPPLPAADAATLSRGGERVVKAPLPLRERDWGEGAPATGLKVAVLLSVGRHPASGRPRRAPADARALELALRLPGASLRAVHAGDPAAPALRDYLGMGLDRLEVLAVPEGGDPVGALVDRLRALKPDLILAGGRGEGGEDSGMVPYRVARALDYALVPDAAALEPADGGAEVLQALPRGQRRLVRVALPAVVTVHPAAPAARATAFGRARRGVIDISTAEAMPDGFLAECERRAWRPRPKPIRAARGGSALDRLKAATETKAGKGQLLVGVPPDEAARAIWDCLVGLGVLPEGTRREDGEQAAGGTGWGREKE